MCLDWKKAIGIVGMAVMLMPGAAVTQEITGDPAAGERVFTRCMACHRAGPGAQSVPTGPTLNGVVDRPAGSLSDFTYSDAMANSGLVWDIETLMAFLEAPQQLVPGTRMAFPGLPNEQDRANVIAYLAQFGPNGNPVE
ncbi:MAG: cytochrome c family protein, partial [Alphaproteobacteria bacterium]